MKIKITLEVPELPDGYRAPVWGPLYTSVAGTTLVLIGERWWTAVNHVTPHNGGRHWIYSEKDIPITQFYEGTSPEAMNPK